MDDPYKLLKKQRRIAVGLLTSLLLTWTHLFITEDGRQKVMWFSPKAEEQYIELNKLILWIDEKIERSPEV